MNQENTGLDKTMLKKFAAGGTVEFENYLPRSKSGMRTWELKIRDKDGSRRISGNPRQRFKCYRHGDGCAAFYKPL